LLQIITQKADKRSDEFGQIAFRVLTPTIWMW